MTMLTHTIPKQLISTGNTKLNKAIEFGYLNEGLSLSPGDKSGYEMCAYRTEGCSKLCLDVQGRGVMTSVQKSRHNKTMYFMNDKVKFMEQLSDELLSRLLYAKRKGLRYAFRPNVFSDREEFWRSGIMDDHPQIQFTDYTKNPYRMDKFLKSLLPRNYYLTFSRSETNDPECEDILSRGGNVAVVFKHFLPEYWFGYPVIDGDVHDLRFLDPQGVVVGLLAKGTSKKSNNAFIVNPLDKE